MIHANVSVTETVTLILTVSAIIWWNLSALSACILIFLVLNLKMLLLASTIRVLPSLARLLLLPTRAPEPKTLFHPHSMTSRCCMLECDVYIHKSNSTFLLDLDVSRAELLTRRFTHGLRCTKGSLVLGGVDISFRREIKPFQLYDTRSAVLAWDKKWIYILSYHVRPGADVSGPGDEGDDWLAAICGHGQSERAQNIKKDVFAVAISKYVAKAGRRTIAPADLLQASGYIALGANAVNARGKRRLALWQGIPLTL